MSSYTLYDSRELIKYVASRINTKTFDIVANIACIASFLKLKHSILNVLWGFGNHHRLKNTIFIHTFD